MGCRGIEKLLAPGGGAPAVPVEAIPTECRPFADDLARGGR
jgi:hypothetical protein